MTVRQLMLSMARKVLDRSSEHEYLQAHRLTDETKVRRFQMNNVAALLSHASRNVPYYANLFADLGVRDNEELSLSALARVPLLTKDIVRSRTVDLTSTDVQKRKWYYNSSGGSTGEPARFIQDDVFTRWSRAVTHYYYRDMLGIDEPRVGKVILWGASRDISRGPLDVKARIKDWLLNAVVLNTFRMTRDDMERYARIINARKPDLIMGYAGSLYELCSYCESKQIDLFTPTRLVSTSETLRLEMRETIERVFQTKVFDFYGSREVTNIAGECRDGRMHLFSFWAYPEVLDEQNRPVREGREGKVVLTTLFNYSMPLIRYEIGDTAVLGPKKCTCGNSLPTLERVGGRLVDRFLREDGTVIPGEFFVHLFRVEHRGAQHVAKFQVIQTDYTRIEILFVPRGEGMTDSDKRALESRIYRVIGDFDVTWRCVDDIPKTKTGKYVYTKSLVWR